MWEVRWKWEWLGGWLGGWLRGWLRGAGAGEWVGGEWGRLGIASSIIYLVNYDLYCIYYI